MKRMANLECKNLYNCYFMGYLILISEAFDVDISQNLILVGGNIDFKYSKGTKIEL